MGLVKDEQAARTKIVEPHPHRGRVRFVDEQALGNEEPRERVPRIDGITAIPADPLDLLTVEDLEPQTEPGIQLLLPLFEHRRGTHHHHLPNPAAKQ